MSIKILQKRSSVASAAPAPAVLEHGELAVNYHDMKVYFKDSTGNVRVLNDWATIHNKPAGLSDVTSTATPNTLVLRDNSGNFSAGIITAALNGNANTAAALQTPRTINGIAFDGTGNITITAATASTLTRGTYLTGSNFDGSAATTWAVNASSVSLASTVVARDASGNFAAGTITAALTGNASTATALQTPRTINGVPFDGTADIIVSTGGLATLTRGTYLTGSNFDGSAATTWAVDATALNTPLTVIARDASGNFSAGTITAALTGNASTATALQTSRTISLSGEVAGSVSFNGTADVDIVTSLGPQPYDVAVTFNGKPLANGRLLYFPVTRPVVFPVGLVGSYGVASTAPTAQADFEIQKNGVSFGTMRFAAASNTATFISVTGASFVAGDIFSVIAPAIQDATLQDLGFSLVGTK